MDDGSGRAAGWSAPDREALSLAVGDHLAIAAVLGYGMTVHNGLDALLDPRAITETLGPFLAGFLVVALLAETYAPPHRDALPASVRAVSVAWFGAVGIGLTLRTTWLVEGGAATPFALVVTGFGLLGLLAWRLAAYAYDRVRSRSGQPTGG